jgi:catechol 1,2-dioxygenase
MDRIKSRHDALDRRQFLKAGSFLGLGAVLLPGLGWLERGAKGTGGGGDCLATSDDILGPFYLAGSPVTTQVASPEEPGTRLFISGTILSLDCLTPIPNAMIEVWQANDAAVYDTSQSFNLRGTMYSDAEGHYAFETIMPGAYLNGNQFRPKHIHYRVNSPGFPPLVTQLYFEGDPYIPADPWASQEDAAMRIIPLNEIGGGQLEGVFDIVLDGHVGIKPNRYGEHGDLLPPHPNPSTDLSSIHFNVFHEAHIQVGITDMQGREVLTLIDEKKIQGRYTTLWNGHDANGRMVPAGTYLIHFLMDGRAVKCQRLGRV